MKLSTYRPVIVAMVGALAVATLAGCAGGAGTKVALPEGVTGNVTVATPEQLSKDLHFALGRDDDFVGDTAQQNGARGLVIAVSNTSDEDIKLGGAAKFGEKAQWGAFDGAPGDYRIDKAKLPKGCNTSQFSVNNADLGESGGDTFSIKAGETLLGCTILTKAAGAGDESIRVTVSDENDADLGQTVKVGKLFAD